MCEGWSPDYANSALQGRSIVAASAASGNRRPRPVTASFEQDRGDLPKRRGIRDLLGKSLFGAGPGDPLPDLPPKGLLIGEVVGDRPPPCASCPPWPHQRSGLPHPSNGSGALAPAWRGLKRGTGAGEAHGPMRRGPLALSRMPKESQPGPTKCGTGGSRDACRRASVRVSDRHPSSRARTAMAKPLPPSPPRSLAMWPGRGEERCHGHTRTRCPDMPWRR